MKVLKDLRFIKCKKGLTIEDILFLVILFVNLGIVLMVLSQGMSGNDYWWHVKTGEWILHHGRIPENDIFKGLADLDERGYFVPENIVSTKTPGVFVAGDCCAKTLRQVATACSDGAYAAIEACNFLSK